MYLRCCWHHLIAAEDNQCSNEAQMMIVAGCLNQHLCERAVCETHFDTWGQYFHENLLGCADCAEDIAEWDLVYVTQLTMAALWNYQQTNNPHTWYANGLSTAPSPLTYYSSTDA